MAEGLKRAFGKIKQNVFEAIEDLRVKEGEEGSTQRKGSMQKLAALITAGSKCEVDQSKQKLRKDGNPRFNTLEIRKDVKPFESNTTFRVLQRHCHGCRSVFVYHVYVRSKAV